VGVNCTLSTLQVFYNDEHALTLGINKVTVKTKTGTSTTTCDVTPLPSPAPSSAANPNVGLTSGGNANTTCSQGDVDVSNRPIYPALFITDITNCAPNDQSCNLGGDWQYGGTGIPPNAVFGTWKGAARLVDMTKSTTNPTITVTPDADPAKNNYNLDGTQSLMPDPVPAGLVNQGYGAEIRWDVSNLHTTNPGAAGGQPLVSGRTYRLYVMVHDGDQNKAGGDSGQACIFLTMP
jgi:hypothetical protein